jgi:DHA2 family multidrug resistance protein
LRYFDPNSKIQIPKFEESVEVKNNMAKPDQTVSTHSIGEWQAQEQHPPGYKWTVMGVIMMGVLMATLDSSIVNVSIPKIMADFGVNVDDIEWVLTGYMLAFATLMPLTGWLRDRIGYKNIYLGALVLFTLGSVLCGMAWNLPSLIAARVIQAIGGGAMQPTGMAIMTEVFPPKERGSAMGLFGVGIILGPAIGPTLGGYLTDYFGWRSIFLVNLPIGIITIIAAFEFMIKDAPHKLIKKPFDFWGFGFLSVFLVCALLGMSKGQKEGWTSFFILTCFTLAVLGFVGFMLVETHIDYPVVDISLFKIPTYTTASIITVARSIGLFGSIFLIPLFVQQQLGYTALQSGLLMLPSSIFMAFLFPLFGRMADKVGAKWPSVIGIIIVAYSLFMYRTIDLNTSVWGLIWPMMVRSVGMGLLMAPITTAVMNSVPQRKIGFASSMNSIMMQVGASMGIAIFGTMLSNRAVYHVAIVGQATTAGNPVFAATVETLMQRAHGLGYTFSQAMMASRGALVGTMTKAALVMSFEDVFIFGAIIVGLSLPLAFMLPAQVVRYAHGHKPEGPPVGD